MKQLRCLFLVLAFGFGWCVQRAQGQTAAQTMSFSIICQYVTNTYTTNRPGTAEETVLVDQHLLTIIIDSANIVKAIAIDMFTNAWTNWQFASLVYEENMTNGNQGIFLRYLGKQTNVSTYFVNSFSPNGYANMFSQDATNAFAGTIFPGFSTNGYANLFAQEATNVYADTNFPANSLPLAGTYGYDNGPVGVGYDNLAYLTLSTSNISMALFGYSQGTLMNTVYDREGHIGRVDKAQIVGVGTFNLNLTTNFLFRTNGYIISTNLHSTNYVTDVVAPLFGTGLAHGTVMVLPPYHLDIGPPEGP